MQAHKFRVGAHVQFKPPFSQPAAAGDFVVERHLPPDGDGNQYRIENRSDGHRRVVHEVNLVRIGSGD